MEGKNEIVFIIINTTRIVFILLATHMTVGCGQTKQITEDLYSKIINKPFTTWTVADCDNIIKYSTFSNSSGMNSKKVYDDVYIEAVRLSALSISAIVRKEAILQRMSYEEFIDRLTFYLEEFTNYTYDTTLSRIWEKPVSGNSLKGYSFRISFENLSNPYRVIDLEDGYAYFFLENKEGGFSRVAEVTGEFADDHFYLGDYIKVVITFSRTQDGGKPLFPHEKYSNDFRLIFNGLQDDPIVIEP